MNTEIKVLVYDLDDTLYENTWKTFNPLMGVTQEENVDLYTKRKNNIIDQQEWLDSLYRIYSRDKNRLKKECILSIVDSLVKNKDTDDTIKHFKDKGYKQYLLSGGLDIITKSVADSLGITFLGASIEATFDTNGILKGFHASPSEPEFKLQQIIKLEKSLSCLPEDIICLGDGDNEKEIFKYTGRGVTFVGSKISDFAWKIIKDISVLKTIL
jgi:HAD superfamily phosphoserine phosphatase-like hydrolase